MCLCYMLLLFFDQSEIQMQQHESTSLGDLRLIKSSHCVGVDSISHTGGAARTFRTLIIKGSCFLRQQMMCDITLENIISMLVWCHDEL